MAELILVILLLVYLKSAAYKFGDKIFNSKKPEKKGAADE